MSPSEQLNIMRLEILENDTDDSKDEVFKVMLENAKNVALNTLFPYNKEIEELPDGNRYRVWQVRCAIELYNKLGNANVMSYSENGLSVSFLSGLVSSSLMAELGPAKAGIIK